MPSKPVAPDATRDMQRFPDNLIGNVLYGLAQTGCDLTKPIEVNFIADFSDLDKGKHQQVLAQAQAFLSSIEAECDWTQLLDFTVWDEDWGADVSVEVHHARVATADWIADRLVQLGAFAALHGGTLRFFVFHPDQSRGWVVLAPETKT